MSLPGHPQIAFHGDELHIEDKRAADLAAEFGTPLYVYSKAAIVACAQPYLSGLAPSGGKPFYALKANSNLSVVKLLHSLGCGADIVSAGELTRALRVGIAAQDIVFSGVGKSASELSYALIEGVGCFNVESEPELDRLNELAVAHGKRAAISLRVNPDVDAKTHPYISTGLKDNKFGVAHADAVRVYERAAQMPGIEIVGIDCHIGSQITDGTPYMDALNRVLDLVEACAAKGIHFKHLDLGGGVGIRYEGEATIDVSALIARLLEQIRLRGFGHLPVNMEPGRAIVGNAGVLLARVEYVKPGEQKNFLIVDAAMNDLARPAMYQSFHSIVNTHAQSGAPGCFDVVGPVCESGDWLGRDRTLRAAAGDVLAILSAGAYSMSMASNYNTRCRGAEVLVDGTTAKLIRARESFEALLASEASLL